MAKKNSVLADIRRKEQLEALQKLSDRDLCEAIKAHFESHPTLPGEKALKDSANRELNKFYDNDRKKENLRMNHDWVSDEEIEVDPSVRDELLKGYAQTRIRETPLEEGNYYLDFRHFNVDQLKREPVDSYQSNGATVYVDKVHVQLQDVSYGSYKEVYVIAEQHDGHYRTIGSLPDKFLTNNPMNVENCDAELQLTDFSNGNLKNLSATLVVDTDLMSGDVIDLDEDMLAGLESDQGLQQ